MLGFALRIDLEADSERCSTIPQAVALVYFEDRLETSRTQQMKPLLMLFSVSLGVWEEVSRTDTVLME
jgi:hypothetical protein